MQVVLENEALKVTINSFGAELASIWGKATDTEYLWNADAKFWKRTAPVLFPFVGSLKNKGYHYEGKTYSMGQHGFARDMEFAVDDRRKLLYTKEKLLANGDQWEIDIAARLRKDAPYR